MRSNIPLSRHQLYVRGKTQEEDEVVVYEQQQGGVVIQQSYIQPQVFGGGTIRASPSQRTTTLMRNIDQLILKSKTSIVSNDELNSFLTTNGIKKVISQLGEDIEYYDEDIEHFIQQDIGVYGLENINIPEAIEQCYKNINECEKYLILCKKQKDLFISYERKCLLTQIKNYAKAILK